MVIENPFLPLPQWLVHSGGFWLLTVFLLGLGALALGFVITAAAHGPGKAGEMVYRAVSAGFLDIVMMSPRRVLAIASLAIREAVRRRIVVGLAIFVLILAFALWFLPTNYNPAPLYIVFVLWATNLLVLLTMLFLSTFSLPNDIKNHTIYTVVTKPVRPSEIVLGRIIGFTALGTAMLAVMCLASYFFVVRALEHTHELAVAQDADQEVAAAADAAPRTLATSNVRGHRHKATLDADGNGMTDVEQGHYHVVTNTGTPEKPVYTVGPMEGQFHARMPIYGKLSFLDREGSVTTKGINVGNEWQYRSFIEGASLQAAIWNFSGIRKQDFPDGLNFELTIRVFRTHKGTITEGVLGSFVLRNPTTKVETAPIPFFAKEFAIDRKFVPAKGLTDKAGNPIELFGDIIDENGAFELKLSCLQGGQYFGMAQPDVYLLPREASFEWNFVKGFAGIWLQMLTLTAFGVMWSTFLNGPVAMLATFATLGAGAFVDKLAALANPAKVVGGGPFESMIKLINQGSISVELEPGVQGTVARGVDHVSGAIMFVISRLVPDFGAMSLQSYVAEGFNIPNEHLTILALMTAGFVIPAFIVGSLCLRLREVAK